MEIESSHCMGGALTFFTLLALFHQIYSIAPTKPIANAYFLLDESQHILPRCSKEIIVTNFPKITKKKLHKDWHITTIKPGTELLVDLLIFLQCTVLYSGIIFWKKKVIFWSNGFLIVRSYGVIFPLASYLFSPLDSVYGPSSIQFTNLKFGGCPF